MASSALHSRQDERGRSANALPARDTQPRSSEPDVVAKLPLAGFTVIDLCNVVAGPACGRVFVELGATVVKIDPMRPQHSPTIMVTFAGETAVGKRSIILDTDTAEGRAIMLRMVSGADMVLANKLDSQFVRLGLDRASLNTLNPSAIGVQLSAHRGDKRGPRHDYPGYDPALQGLTGIMVRFRPGRLPHVSWHRVMRGLSLRLSWRLGRSHRAGGAGAPQGRTW